MILTENSHLCIRLSIEAVLNHLRATKTLHLGRNMPGKSLWEKCSYFWLI